MAEMHIPRLAPEAVKAALDRGDRMLLVDVRKPTVYRRGHISGAICFPITELEAWIEELPAGRSLVFY